MRKERIQRQKGRGRVGDRERGRETSFLCVARVWLVCGSWFACEKNLENEKREALISL